MSNKIHKTKDVKLSASRLKTAKTCSWLYWSKYHLNLPEKKNDGASRGDICHAVFECLGKDDKKRRKHFKKILKEEDAFCIPSIKRMILKRAERLNVDDEENLRQINEMIVTGLRFDFFGKDLQNPTEAFSEYEFDLHVKKGKKNYKIKGYIDKLFLYKKKNLAVIRDFKTSKKVFEGEEISKNLQDYIYCLAVKHMFPDYDNRKSEFLFLKFDLDGKGYLEMESISEEDLEKFEKDMTQAQTYLENFDIRKAKSSYAADKPRGEGFVGQIVCGFAKYPGEPKKDGNPKWHCHFKFPFDYYCLTDEEGHVKMTALAEDYAALLKKKGENDKIEKRHYEGCPRWNYTSY